MISYYKLLSEILFEAQATGKGAVSRNNSLIDSQLLSNSFVVLPVLNIKPKSYNKSKKCVMIEISDNKKEAQAPKKIDLAQAIAGMTAEMAHGQKAREETKSAQEKAVQLLESVYGDRLDTMIFIQACTFFEDEQKARSFLAITNIERHDRWLEINLRTELRSVI